MNRYSMWLPALAACAVVAGCGPKPEDQLVGNWKFQDVQAAGAPAQEVEQGRKQLASSSLAFGKDKSFALTFNGMKAIEGTWSVAERNITISPTKVGGQDVAKMKAQFEQVAKANPQMKAQLQGIGEPMKASISPDGKTVTMSASGGKQASATYSKA